MPIRAPPNSPNFTTTLSAEQHYAQSRLTSLQLPSPHAIATPRFTDPLPQPSTMTIRPSSSSSSSSFPRRSAPLDIPSSRRRSGGVSTSYGASRSCTPSPHSVRSSLSTHDPHSSTATIVHDSLMALTSGSANGNTLFKQHPFCKECRKRHPTGGVCLDKVLRKVMALTCSSGMANVRSFSSNAMDEDSFITASPSLSASPTPPPPPPPPSSSLSSSFIAGNDCVKMQLSYSPSPNHLMARNPMISTSLLLNQCLSKLELLWY